MIVILKLAPILALNGGTGCAAEHLRPGVDNLSDTRMGIIANLGTDGPDMHHLPLH